MTENIKHKQDANFKGFDLEAQKLKKILENHWIHSQFTQCTSYQKIKYTRNSNVLTYTQLMAKFVQSKKVHHNAHPNLP